jgi:hypothetical protein
MSFRKCLNALAPVLPTAATFDRALDFGKSLTVNIMGAMMLLRDADEPSKSDYLNLSFMLKLYNMWDTASMAVHVYNNFEEAKGTSTLKKPALLAAAGGVMTNTATWASGPKAKLGAGIVNCVFNYGARQLSSAHRKGALLDADALLAGQDEGQRQQYQPPGHGQLQVQVSAPVSPGRRNGI